jgi:hypothetical protein
VGLPSATPVKFPDGGQPYLPTLRPVSRTGMSRKLQESSNVTSLGFTAPATAASIHLRRRCAGSSRPCPEATATFVTVRHSRPTVDFDRVGRVSVQVFEEVGVPPAADFYICGPAAFMSGLVDGLAGRGVARNRLFTENFGSDPSKTPGIAAVPRRPPHPPAEAAEVGPLVSFTRSNLAVRWVSAFHSLLELAEACDVPVRWSCRTGVRDRADFRLRHLPAEPGRAAGRGQPVDLLQPAPR